MLGTAAAAPVAQPNVVLPAVSIGVANNTNPQDVAVGIQILLVLTVLSLAPSFLVMMTSFVRIVIVLGFLRNALATQQAPPTQVLLGLALFLTFFVMSPYLSQINDNALQPFLAGKMGQEQAFVNAMEPLREFMFKQTRENDIALFINISKSERPASPAEVPNSVLIPAFIISELKTAFQMGFMIYIPFIVIDMVVASTLMSMGMMMVPPAMISLPFKLLLFVPVSYTHL
ncbi:MAG: flagellar type III secretion system pore protein FliP, partial [Negativicutes bacterium]|nr:flagellar type III secretion system pore protein FliP [Negativicutes bacterium]